MELKVFRLGRKNPKKKMEIKLVNLMREVFGDALCSPTSLKTQLELTNDSECLRSDSTEKNVMVRAG